MPRKKPKFKMGDKVVFIGYPNSDSEFSKGDIATVLSLPGDEWYDSMNYLDAEKGMMTTVPDGRHLFQWSYQDEFRRK